MYRREFDIEALGNSGEYIDAHIVVFYEYAKYEKDTNYGGVFIDDIQCEQDIDWHALDLNMIEEMCLEHHFD